MMHHDAFQRPFEGPDGVGGYAATCPYCRRMLTEQVYVGPTGELIGCEDCAIERGLIGEPISLGEWFEPEGLHDVLRQFGLSNWKIRKPDPTPTQQPRAHYWEIMADGSRYFLKRFYSWYPATAVQHMHSVMAHLIKQQIPAPQWVADTTTGQSYAEAAGTSGGCIVRSMATAPPSRNGCGGDRKPLRCLPSCIVRSMASARKVKSSISGAPGRWIQWTVYWRTGSHIRTSRRTCWAISVSDWRRATLATCIPPCRSSSYMAITSPRTSSGAAMPSAPTSAVCWTSRRRTAIPRSSTSPGGWATGGHHCCAPPSPPTAVCVRSRPSSARPCQRRCCLAR